MSECCLPNLGCLSIPIISTQVAGQAGTPGAAGRSIVDEYYEPSNGELTLTFSEAPLTYTTGDLRGAQGDTGATGLDGVSRLYYNSNDSSSGTAGSFVTVFTYTLPADMLIENGDSLVINMRSVRLTADGNPFGSCQRRITFASTSCTLFTSAAIGGSPSEPDMVQGESTGLQYNTRVEIIKTSVNQARCMVTSDLCIETSVIPVQYISYQNILTGLDFTTTNTINADLLQSVVGQVRIKSFTIDKIKKAV
jgi:hypothetical protein